MRSRTLKTHNRAGQACHLAAQGLSHGSPNACGAFCRRMRAKFGPKLAMVATAHKFARIFYHVLTQRTPFQEQTAREYDQRTREREIRKLQKKAAQFGMKLVALPA